MPSPFDKGNEIVPLIRGSAIDTLVAAEAAGIASVAEEAFTVLAELSESAEFAVIAKGVQSAELCAEVVHEVLIVAWIVAISARLLVRVVTPWESPGQLLAPHEFRHFNETAGDQDQRCEYQFGK